LTERAGALIEIINQCWDRNPFLRPTAATIADTLLNVGIAISLDDKRDEDSEIVVGNSKSRREKNSERAARCKEGSFACDQTDKKT
jgi:hypothetical protein